MRSQQVVKICGAGSIPARNEYGLLDFLLTYFRETFDRFEDAQPAAEIVHQKLPEGEAPKKCELAFPDHREQQSLEGFYETLMPPIAEPCFAAGGFEQILGFQGIEFFGDAA